MSNDDEVHQTIRRSAVSVEVPSDSAPLPIEPDGRFAVPEGVPDIELGRGGMGRVLHLRDVHLERDVAVKELLTENDEAGAALRSSMFVREAQVLARLDHPGVVPIYELGRRADGRVYYAMRRIKGRTLGDALEACSTLEDRLSLLPHLLDVVQTMAFSHHRGITHRDLKPDNVMIGEFGETLVVDWGLAQFETDQVTEGRTAGTPAYMSPEQAAGRKTDKRSDVWSLGVMLFELLTGRLPFDAKTASDMMNAVQKSPIPRVGTVQPGVSHALALVAEQAMRRDPTERFSSAEELSTALGKAIADRGPKPWKMQAIAGALGLAVVALLSFAFSQQAAAARIGDLAERAAHGSDNREAELLSRLALNAWRDGDTREAETQSAAALALNARDPLARGLGTLLKSAPTVKPVWAIKTEAGCSSTLIAADQVFCATLNGVKVFSAADGKELASLSSGVRGWQRAMTFAADGTLVFAGDDRVIHVWNVTTRSEIFHSAELSQTVTTLAATPEGVLIGLHDGNVSLMKHDRSMQSVTHEEGAIRVLAQANGQRVVGTADSLTLTTLSDGKTVHLDQPARAVLPLKNGQWLAALHESVVLFDGTRPTVWPGHHAEVTALAQGGSPISGSDDGEVRIWTADGRPLMTMHDFTQGISSLAADERHVAVATGDRGLHFIELPQPSNDVWAQRIPSVNVVEANPELILAGYRDGTIERLGAGPLEIKHAAAVKALASVHGEKSAKKLRFISGSEDGHVQGLLWSGETVVLDTSIAAPVTTIAVSADGSIAAWAFTDGTFALWNVLLGKEIFRERQSPVRALTFAPKGLHLAVARDDKRISILEADSGKEIKILEPMNAPSQALVFSKNGKTLYSAVNDGEVLEWDLESGRNTHQWNISDRAVTTLSLSDDDWHLYAGTQGSEVVMLNAWNHETLARMPLLAGRVTLLSKMPESNHLIVTTDQPHLFVLLSDEGESAGSPPPEWIQGRQ